MRKGSSLHRFLSRIYWWYHRRWEAYLERKRCRELRRRIRSPFGKKVYLIGTPTHENVGDSAIVLAQKAFLQKCGWEAERVIEITDVQYRRDWEKICKWIPKGALITQLGGGHMGNQWVEEEKLHQQQVLRLPKNPAVIFPQTLYYTPDEKGEADAKASVPVYNGKKQLTMVAREAFSFEAMQRLYPDTQVLLVPDIVLSMDMAAFGAREQQRDGVILCMRGDLEQSMTQEERAKIEEMLQRRTLPFRRADMYCVQMASPENREQVVREKLEELSSAKLVITDRLHGMIFCALTGTPCIVFSNSNHKIKGTYEWLRHLPYIQFVQSVREAEAHLDGMLQMKDCRFDNAPLRPYYEQLAEVVKRYV